MDEEVGRLPSKKREVQSTARAQHWAWSELITCQLCPFHDTTLSEIPAGCENGNAVAEGVDAKLH